MKNHIKKFREERQITQEQLSEIVGVSRQTIISLEKFKYAASLQLARSLSVYFNTTIEALFIFDEEEKR